MKTITFIRTLGDMDAQCRASGIPVPYTTSKLREVLDALAEGTYARIWVPHKYAMTWRHPHLNARNTRIEFLGKYDDFEKRVVRERLQD
jgi:hypothetical protein